MKNKVIRGEILCGTFLTFIAGSAVGVCLMCLLQINRRHPQMEYDFEAANQKEDRMKNSEEQHDTYIIPPNFIEGGTLFGGMFKIRNVIEAGILAVSVGIPVFLNRHFAYRRIILLCLTALPLGLLALIGIAGEPLSSYIFPFQMAEEPPRHRQG